jgi:hypothetical protein
MNKLPAIFTALRSNLSFVVALPLFWLFFVLLYQPARLVTLLNMGGGMFNFNTGSYKTSGYGTHQIKM